MSRRCRLERRHISEKQRPDGRTRRLRGLLFARRRRRLVLLCGGPGMVRSVVAVGLKKPTIVMCER
jgi:hypothetical protein